MSDLKNPTALSRTAPFWSWNDKLDEAELRRQIREMADKGWGSYFIHSRVGLVTGYLSDEWMRLVNACADEAEKTGTLAWLYDEDKFPSGFAGGEVPVKDPLFRARSLLLLSGDQITENDTVMFSAVENGVERFVCKRVFPLGDPWFNGTSYVDLMNPEAVKEFLLSTHERYKAACGEHFGKAIPGIFTDEPCYLLCNHCDVACAPWSEYLPGFFLKQNGYDIIGKVGELFFDIGDYQKTRFDFYRSAGELFKESFTKQYYNWCEENGLLMTGHLLGEETGYYQALCAGDVMNHYESMHWPGIDKLCRTIGNIVPAKQVSTVADQLGKERALCEVFGCSGQQVAFFHRKWMSDYQVVLGISFINPHLSLYSMRGERKRDFPPNFFYQQPWWSDERGFADYEGRLCTFASEGERLVDILVFQPLTSVWCQFSPKKFWDQGKETNPYDPAFERISVLLAERKLDFHYGNESLMARHGSVEGGKLKVGVGTYGCVILPPALNITFSTLALLREYAECGRLIVVGDGPSLVDGVPAYTHIDGAVYVDSIEDAVGLAEAYCPDRVRVLGAADGENAAKVYLHSRRVGEETRHLFVNTDEEHGVSVVVDIPDSAEMSAVDLCSGVAYRLPAEEGRFPVHLSPAGSLLVTCGGVSDVPDLPPLLGSGAVFELPHSASPQISLSDLRCRTLDENVLVLHDFTLSLDGVQVYEGPVGGAWYTHFYPAPNGTSFRAVYSFDSDVELDGCFAAIEVAENLDSITFNGEGVKPAKSPGELGAFDPEKSWLDINLTRVPLPPVQVGTNTLVIEGRKVNNISGPSMHDRVHDWAKHLPTEAEEIFVCGRFSVDPSSRRIMPFVEPTGRDLVSEGFPFYCGRVEYRASFDIDELSERSIVLELGGASLSSAAISINGVDLGAVIWPPYMIDISSAIRRGTNDIVIDASLTMVNAFGPNRTRGIKEDVEVGPHSFVPSERYTDDYQLFPFGLKDVTIYLV